MSVLLAAFLSVGEASATPSSDPSVTVGFAAGERDGSHVATEGGLPAEVVVTLGTRPLRPVTVPITVLSGSASSSDHGPVPGSVSFGPDDLSVTFSVAAVDDSDPEADEDLVIGLGDPLPAGVSAGARPAATLRVEDNDSNRLVFEAPGGVRISENDSATTVSLTASLRVARTSPFEEITGLPTVFFGETRLLGLSGSATYGEDYMLDGSWPRLWLAPAFPWHGSVSILPIRDSIPEDDEYIVIGNVLPNFVTEYVTVTLTDAQDPAEVGFAVTPQAVNEGEVAELLVTLSTPLRQDVSVPWQAAEPGELSPGSASGSVTFAAGEHRATIRLSVADDGLPEPSELLTVSLGRPSPDLDGRVRAGSDRVAHLQVNSADLVVAGFDAPESPIVVEGRAVEIPITLSSPIGDPPAMPSARQGAPDPVVEVLVINAAETGTAERGTDFVTANGDFIISGNASAVPGTVTVFLLEDDETDSGETIVLGVDAAGRGVVGDGRLLTLTVLEPTNGAPAFAGSGAMQRRPVVRGSAAGVAVGSPVTARDPDGDALSYQLEGSGLFGIEEASGQITVMSTISASSGPRAEHTVTVAVSDGKGDLGEADPSIDARMLVLVTLTGASKLTADISGPSQVTDGVEGLVDEGQVAVFEVELSDSGSQTVFVPWSVDNAEDAAPASRGGTLAFAPGELAKSIAVTLLDDGLAEPWELIEVALGTPSRERDATGQEDGDTGRAYALVRSTDPVTVALAAPPTARVAEGSSVVIPVSLSAPVPPFMAARDPSLPADVTVGVSLGGAAAGGQDLELASTLVTVAARSGPQSGAFTVSVLADADADAGETVVLGISVGGRSGVVADAAEVTLTVTEPNAAPAFAASGVTLTRLVDANSVGGNPAGPPVSATDADRDTLSYRLEGSALFGIDSGNGQITVAPGAVLRGSVSAHTVTVSVSDGLNEWGESDPATDAQVPVVVSVTDDGGGHPPVTVGFANAKGDSEGEYTYVFHEVIEGERPAEVTVTLDARPLRPVTVPVVVLSGRASAADHGPVPRSVTFGPDDLSVTFSIAAIDDTEPETDEGLVIGIGGPLPAGVSAGADTTVTLTLKDNDSNRIAFTALNVDDMRLNESDAPLGMVVQVSVWLGRSTAPGSAGLAAHLHSLGRARLQFSGSAKLGEDYVLDPPSPPMVSFNPFITDFEGVTIIPVDDGIPEGGEYIVIGNSRPNFITEYLTVTLDDGAAPAVIGLGLAPREVYEGEAFEVPVTMSTPQATEVSVPWWANDAGELAPGSASGTVTFAAGEQSATIRVTVVDDGLAEPWEVLTVSLGSPSPDRGGQVRTGEDRIAHMLVVSADRVVGGFGAPESRRVAEGSWVRVPVTLSAPIAAPVAIPWHQNYIPPFTVIVHSTDESTARRADFAGLPLIRVIEGEAGATVATAAIFVAEDDEADAGETIVLEAKLLGRGLVSEGTKLTLTVVEGDNGAPAFADSGATLSRAVAENSGEGTPVGAPVAATDPDGDALSYRIEGSGLFGIDEGSGQVTVAPGAVLDHESAAEHTVTVAVSDGADTDWGDDPSADASVTVAVSVTDVDEAVVTIGSAVRTVDEGDTAELAVLLSPAASQPVSVPWSVGDPAEVGPGSSGGTLVFAPGSVSETIRVAVLDDGLAEPWELLTVSLGTPSTERAATILVDGTGTGHVLVNSSDPLNVGLEGPANTRITEGRAAELRVVLPGPLAELGPAAAGLPADVTVSVTVGGSATSGADFLASPGAVTITAGDPAPPGAVTVSVLEDGLSDAGETIVVDFSVEGRGGVGVSGQGVTLTVAEHNRPPFFPDAGGAYISIIENSDAGALVGDPVAAVDLDGDSLTYSLEAPGEFGIDGASGQITVAPGGTLDYEVMRKHTVTVAVSDGVDQWGDIDPSVDARAPVSISVTNEQWEHPDVIGAAGASSWDQSPTGISVVWTFRPSYDGNPPVTVYIQHRKRGTGAWQDGRVRYNHVAQTAVITGLERRTRYDLRLRALAGADGGDWVNLRSGTRHSFGIRRSARSRSVVPEGAVASVVVTVQEPLAEALTVRYSLRDGSATGGTPGAGLGGSANGLAVRGAEAPEPGDFTDLGGGAVVIPPAELSATILVALEDDSVPERPEVFGVRIEGASLGGGEEDAPSIGQTRETSVTIAASDAVVLSLEGPSGQDLPEGEAAELTVMVTGEPARSSLTVGLAADSGGGAPVAGISMPGSVTVPAGTEAAVFTVRALADGVADGGEVVRIGLAEIPGGDAQFLIEPAPVALTVTEPNKPPAFLVRGTVTVTVREGDDQVGTPVLATDPDGDRLTYSLAGRGAFAAFGIDAESGRISFANAGVADHEDAPRHVLTVQAADGRDGRGIPDFVPDAETALVVEVADTEEPPPAPVGVSASPAGADGFRRLTVVWEDPASSGPRLLGHEIEAASASGSVRGKFVAPGAAATVDGLLPGTRHTVRVRALNEEGNSEWSAPAVAQTDPGNRLTVRGAPLSVLEGEVVTVRIGSLLPAREVTARYQVRHVDTSAADMDGALAGSVVLGEGSRSAVIEVSVASDGLPEGPEVFVVGLTGVEDPDGFAVLGPVTEVPVTIGADGAALSVTGPAGGRVARGTPATLTVASVGNPLASAVTVSLLSPASSFGHELSAGHLVLGPGTPEGTAVLSVDSGALPGSALAVSLGTDAPGVGLGAPLALTVVEMNDQPSFPAPAGAAATVMVAENIPPGSAIGDAVAAADDNDAPTYTLAGGGGLFDVDAGGQLRLAKGAFLDHETARAHRVVVEASDRKNDLGLPDTAVDARAVVTVVVGDVAEPPPAPSGLSVGAAPAHGDSRLEVSWDAPGGPGLPRITGYDIEHRVKGDGAWSSGNVSRDGATAVIHGLARDTEHEVRVRARNAEDTAGGEVVAPWSAVAAGATRGGLVAHLVPRTAGSGEGVSDADMLLMFYSLRFGNFLEANPRLLKLVFGRVAAPARFATDQELVATITRSEEFAHYAGFSEYDTDRNGVFDHADALLMFYSLRFGEFLKANPQLLQLVFGRILPNSGGSLPQFLEIVDRANALR